MNNIEKYINVFRRTFDIGEQPLEEITYQSIPSWDSVGHMALVSALENAFGICLDMEDILNLNSYSRGIEILEKKNIQF